MPGSQELIIILLIVVLLFGAKKIPDLAKGIGKGIKNFKNEMKDETPDTVASNEETRKVEGGETAADETPKTTEKQA